MPLPWVTPVAVLQPVQLPHASPHPAPGPSALPGKGRFSCIYSRDRCWCGVVVTIPGGELPWRQLYGDNSRGYLIGTVFSMV